MGFRLFVAITIVAWFSLTLGFGQGPVNSTPFVPNFTSRSSDEDQAIKTLRVFHSVQVVYSLGAGKGDFCSPTELFNESLIDADVANASGVPAMVSKSGKKCLGTGAPFHRYIFVATFKPKSVQQDSTFSVVARVADLQNNKLRNRNFFVDDTGVIRFAPTPGTIPTARSVVLNR